MSTRSRIAYLNKEDNTYHSVYCHWDGYPKNNGKILLKYYTDLDKIKQLVDNGDFPSLHSDLDLIVRFEDSKTINFNSITELIDWYNNSDQDYLYLYENDKWIYWEHSNFMGDLKDYFGEK